MNPETPSSPQQPTPPRKGNASAATTQSAGAAAGKTTVAQPAKTPPLYRSVDWLTFGFTTLVIFVGYMLTLSPDLTLEDSGELAVGSMYAGVPHPPGYPVWTVFTWIFTKILPFSNIAWRVSVASAVAASLACGLLAMLTSRGSSMIIESIADLKGIERRSENAICVVAGFVSAMLLAYNGFMWSQAVIVEVYPFSVLSLLGVLACLLRWVYAPHQRRYIYWAAFLFGICITNHQTLLVAAMGLEIAIIAANPKVGRDLLVINCLCWLAGLIIDPGSFKDMAGKHNMVFNIFNLVGISSAAALAWLIIKTQSLLTEWKTVILIGLLWAVGVAFYFYIPIASMSNPPMNWGYPRTVEGFFHALSRGQYERTNPTDFIHDPGRFISQVVMYFQGAVDEFTLVYLLFAIVPFIFFMRMQRREKAWMIGLFGIYICLGFLLMVLLNPSPDRQTKSLVKVFFTASYVPVSLWIGYGITLTAAWMLTQFQRTRFWVMVAGAVAALAAFMGLYWATITTYGDIPGATGVMAGPKALIYAMQHLVSRGLGSLPIWGALWVVVLVIAFLVLVLLSRERVNLKVLLTIFALMPLVSVISHWAENEQRGHLFGFYFGHDMFTPPFTGTDGKLTYDPKLRAELMKDPAKAKFIYPEMDRDAVLYGGTDPGRFCPTYMIFDESFIPPNCRRDPNFDRRDVYIITQNALADNTYLAYIRAHYNRSAQIDPPFFQKFLPTEFPNTFHNDTRALAWLDDIFEGLGAKIERSRRCGTSWFKESDFLNVKDLASKMQKSSSDVLGKYLYDNCSKETQSLLDNKSDESALKRALVKDLNEILQNGSIYSADRFQNVKLPVLILHTVQTAPEGKPTPFTAWANTSVRLNRRMLEEAYPLDIVKSLGGVFPDTEIRSATVEDSAACFNEYITDATKRAEHDARVQNEPRQIRQGEDVHFDNSGHVQVSGQVAVMAINGLLTKVIFDKNPDHEFYVEESFPLDWMYPYLSPFGVIMKINRQPLELTDEIIARDHDFWSKFSDRLTGNWITYDTTVEQVCNWAEKVYYHHDYSGFTGDPKFVRDDDGQKAFSKLRSSIGGIYQWRSDNKGGAEGARCRKEAEFAFKQAFAYCPYSPEAVYRFVQLLLRMGRVDDAIRIAKTCQKLDPFNGQITGLIEQLENSRHQASLEGARSVMGQVERLIQARQTNEAAHMLETLSGQYGSDPAVLMSVASAYVQMGDLSGSERVMKKMLTVAPDSAETWYNLASLQAAQRKTNESLETLKKAMQVNDSHPASQDLRTYNKNDHNFDALRNLPEFQRIIK
ncbi:MAG: protein O-mannosyl-transferase family [Limisphaerales bacterium]